MQTSSRRTWNHLPICPIRYRYRSLMTKMSLFLPLSLSILEIFCSFEGKKSKLSIGGVALFFLFSLYFTCIYDCVTYFKRVQLWKALDCKGLFYQCNSFNKRQKQCNLWTDLVVLEKPVQEPRRERTLFISTKSMPISATNNKLQTVLGANQVFTRLPFGKFFCEWEIGNVFILVHLMALLYTVQHQQISQLTRHHYTTS